MPAATNGTAASNGTNGANGSATGTGAAAAGSAASATATASGASAASAPSTPVKVPSAAASYTPATLDPDLRSQINMVLIRDGHVSRIQDYLLHILHADNANWPATVQAHALQLLRTGECLSFPALMERVLDDVRTDPQFAVPQAVIDEALRATRESLDMVCEIEE